LTESGQTSPSQKPARRSIPDWVWYGAGGFSAGILLALLTVGLPLWLRSTAAQGPQGPIGTGGTPSAAVPTATSPSAEATRVEIQAIVETGCQYLSNQTIDPASAIELLSAHLMEITDHTDLVRAYECLATAEAMLLHFQMAASYFEELYLLEPSVEYLFEAAQSYDNGGDLQRALEKYLLVIETDDDDPDAEMYKAWALERATELQDTLQYPHPTASPSPSPSP
jgi:tetratricopeptide (TPR) repeat protein